MTKQQVSILEILLEEKNKLNKEGMNFIEGQSFEFKTILSLKGIKDLHPKMIEVIKNRIEEIDKEIENL